MTLNIDDLGVCGIVVEDWDITKEFKPKTITTDYTSWICYISRRPVPANTPITNTYYWKPLTRLQTQLAFDYNQFKEAMDVKFNNLKLLVESFLKSTEFGIALANEFGNDVYVGVNQKLLTESLNRVWNKFEDITGELLQGIALSVTPSYYIGENGANVHITANTVETNGIFEHIAVYINGALIAEDDNVETFEADTTITETSVVKCVAKILGVEYERQTVVTHYNSFWLGAGTSYSDVMTVANLRPIANGMRGAYDIDVADDNHIIIVVGESLAPEFIRADLNGVEIGLTESTVTIDETNYKVYTSDDAFIAGTFNIDING